MNRIALMSSLGVTRRVIEGPLENQIALPNQPRSMNRPENMTVAASLDSKHTLSSEMDNTNPVVNHPGHIGLLGLPADLLSHVSLGLNRSQAWTRSICKELRDSHDSCITDVVIRRTRRPAAFCSSLGSALARLPNLRSLATEEPHHGGGGAVCYRIGEAVALSLRAIAAADAGRLRSLSLGGGIREHECAALSVAVGAHTGLLSLRAGHYHDCVGLLRCLSAASLTSLSLFSCDLAGCGAALSAALLRLPALERLALESVWADDAVYAAIGSAPPRSLATLTILDCDVHNPAPLVRSLGLLTGLTDVTHRRRRTPAPTLCNERGTISVGGGGRRHDPTQQEGDHQRRQRQSSRRPYATRGGHPQHPRRRSPRRPYGTRGDPQQHRRCRRRRRRRTAQTRERPSIRGDDGGGPR
jgi:hypothetical protein